MPPVHVLLSQCRMHMRATCASWHTALSSASGAWRDAQAVLGSQWGLQRCADAMRGPLAGTKRLVLHLYSMVSRPGTCCW